MLPFSAPDAKSSEPLSSPGQGFPKFRPEMLKSVVPVAIRSSTSLRGAEAHAKQGGSFQAREFFVVLVAAIEIPVLVGGPVGVVRPPIVALVGASVLAERIWGQSEISMPRAAERPKTFRSAQRT